MDRLQFNREHVAQNRNLAVILRNFCVIVCVAAFTINYHTQKKLFNEEQQVRQWLKQNGLKELTDSFLENDITSLRKVSELSEEMINKLAYGSGAIYEIREAKHQMVESQRYKTWIMNNNLAHFEHEFRQMDIYTLSDVIDNMANLKSIQYMDAYRALFQLEADQNNLERYEIFYNPYSITLALSWLWSLFKWAALLLLVIVVIFGFIARYFMDIFAQFIIGVFVKVIVAIFTPRNWRRGGGGGVQFAAPTFQLPRVHRPQQPPNPLGNFVQWLFNNSRSAGQRPPNNVHPNTNTSFFDTMLLRGLNASSSTVKWETDSFVAGKEMILNVKFYAQNGTSYLTSKLASLKCEILCNGSMIESAIVHSETNKNEVHVHFTPIVAKETYQISILADGQHVGDSPISKEFSPGPVDPQKSSLVVPSSMLVVEQGKQTKLTFDERDKYGNVVISNDEDLLKYSFVFHEFREGGQQLFPTLTFAPRDNFMMTSTSPNEAWLTLDSSGVYTVDVFYENEPLSQGVTLLVLTEQEMNEVNKNITSSLYNLYYEAYTFSSNLTENVSIQDESFPGEYQRFITSIKPEDGAKKKKVYCYISSKFFTVKEFYMKIFEKRKQVVRIKPSVKIVLHCNDPENGVGPGFTVHAPFETPITVYCARRNVLVGTFIKLLLRNVGGSEKFEDKKRHFQSVLESNAPSHSTITLKVKRDQLLKDSMQATKNFNKNDWSKKFLIKFDGEEGLDYGGLSREWFTLVLDQLFNNRGGLFQRFNKENPQALIHPNPQRTENYQKLKLYEFAGQMVGKCLVECACGRSRQQYVKARFTRSFLAQILGLRVSWKHFETDDKPLYIGKIKYILENDPEGLDIFFSEDVYDSEDRLIKTVDLKSNGSQMEVSESNKMEYIQLVAEYRLQESVKQEITGFIKGLHSIIDDGLLSIFDENELELLMCGMDNISVSDMKQHCDAPNNNLMNQFWSILSGFSQEELSRLLQFITGSAQLPPEGFAGLLPKLRITFTYTRDQLPSSHTCSNHLVLSSYSNMDEFRRKLVYAITEGCEGFGMI